MVRANLTVEHPDLQTIIRKSDCKTLNLFGVGHCPPSVWVAMVSKMGNQGEALFGQFLQYRRHNFILSDGHGSAIIVLGQSYC